ITAADELAKQFRVRLFLRRSLRQLAHMSQYVLQLFRWHPHALRLWTVLSPLYWQEAAEEIALSINRGRARCLHDGTHPVMRHACQQITGSAGANLVATGAPLYDNETIPCSLGVDHG